jgi:transcription elongation factor Elf1
MTWYMMDCPECGEKDGVSFTQDYIMQGFTTLCSKCRTEFNVEFKLKKSKRKKGE